MSSKGEFLIMLHTNRAVFDEIISLISSGYGINSIFIEKDYYVFMLLKLIYMKDNEIMFKGGTSLSKAWGVLDRFSEDIDLNIRPEIPSTDSHRMKINNAVYNSIVELGFDYDRTKMNSRREYNTFEFAINRGSQVSYIRDIMKIKKNGKQERKNY